MQLGRQAIAENCVVLTNLWHGVAPTSSIERSDRFKFSSADVQTADIE